MKKVLYTFVCLAMAAGGFVGGLWFAGYRIKPIRISPNIHHNRQLPETADLGAYLAGILARNSQDIERAAHYFEQAYLGDTENKELVRETYLLNGLAGHFNIFMQTAEQLIGEEKSYYAPLFLAADAVKRGDYEYVLKNTPLFNSADYAQGLLYAVIRAWSHAALGNEIRAFQALNTLKEKKEALGTYWYQKALIAIYLKKNLVAKEAFERLSQMELPTIASLVAARQFYLSLNEWDKNNVLFQKYEKAVEDNKALGEILINRADEPLLITPRFGVGDAFFLISTVWDIQEKSAETGLMFNQLALYLVPDSNIYKIWGAEQFEMIKYYKEANKLYNLIRPTSGTILFKKALNLMLMNDMEGAENLFKGLSQQLPENSMLITMLGNLYRDTNRPELAEQQYNSALKFVDEMEDKEVANLHFMRAVVLDKMKRTEERDLSLIEALKITPNDAKILNYLGYVWIDEGKNVSQAVDYIKRAHQLTPKEAYIWDSLAWGYYKQEKYDVALSFAERAADKMPYSALVQSHLGDIYFALGRKREAKYQYNKALNLKEDMTDTLRVELTQKLSTR
ncbi:MAG: hypothetical protein IKV03_02230 [Alphaproteobacteria bacterium]|nr:hypothetical protein [Alphaproteobacteria bacterium]